MTEKRRTVLLVLLLALEIVWLIWASQQSGASL
jgi:hypothetical protein